MKNIKKSYVILVIYIAMAFILTSCEGNKAIIIYSEQYDYAFGSDYVYITDNKKVYLEREVENPDFKPKGPTSLNYQLMLSNEQYESIRALINKNGSITEKENNEIKEILIDAGLEIR